MSAFSGDAGMPGALGPAAVQAIFCLPCMLLESVSAGYLRQQGGQLVIRMAVATDKKVCA